MKKIFLFTVCILFEYAAFARGNITIDTAQYVAIYDYQCRTLDAKGQPVVDSLQMALQVSRYISRFSTYYEYLVTTKQATSRPFTDIAFSDPLLTETHIFFQNHPAGRLTALESMPPYIYQTDEKVPKIHWTLSADTLTIAGHLCHKATGQFGGRLWTVFYATDIPSSAGPWKLCGLSGLILSASDEAHKHRTRYQPNHFQ
jgi:GLPGLI family protein